jgi:hypothetical protein
MRLKPPSTSTNRSSKILKPIQKQVVSDCMAAGLVVRSIGEIVDTKPMEEKPMAKIGDKTISFIHETIFHMLVEKQQILNEAYIRAEGDKLTIAISATVSPAKRDNETTVKVAMSFVKEKVKDELEVTIDEAQQELFQKPE